MDENLGTPSGPSVRIYLQEHNIRIRKQRPVTTCYNDKPHLLPRRRRSSQRLPLRPRGDLPIAMTVPVPVRLRDRLLLRRNEHIKGAHAILLLRTSLDPRQRRDAVVDDHTDLRAGGRGALKHCVEVEGQRQRG